ncbi:hypothetical protein [Pseudomonas canadensis]|uniref:hypothetical protein n=1 Tax=Pseudomonas canadensis TaxID=915099 RepID=UPI003B9F37D8
MEQFIEMLAKEWVVVSQAPIAFSTLAVGMFGLAYFAARWRYTSVLEQVRASNDTLNERLHLKSEQAELYKDRALKYDEKVWAVVESDASSLAQKSLLLVSQIREFIDRHKRQDDSVREYEWVEMTAAADEVEKNRLWSKFINATSRLSTERNAEWERRFKVDAIMLRDELRSRLKDYKPDERAAHVYEHPTNYFGFNDVAADLERMAKLLLPA